MNTTDSKDALGNRMKNYEEVSRNVLTRRIPVIIRVDGKSFHSFCKRFQRPYDHLLHACLNHVMRALCDEIQGAKFAERHSDEISVLVTDFDDITTEAYFGYIVPKICSVVAATASVEFCKQLSSLTQYLTKDEAWPRFDCRAFNIPEDDVVNYFYWRQRDCIRNSISMFAQSKFSHNELNGKNCKQMQEMMWQKDQFNWDHLPQEQKTGWVCIRRILPFVIPKGPMEGKIIDRESWVTEPAPANRPELAQMIEGIKLRKEVEVESVVSNP